jgi:PKD repeat protein
MPRSLRHGLPAALAVLLCLPGSALADTLTVDPADANNACTRGSDATCRTIAQAVGQAQGGDTIQVNKGTYPESVTIPSSLSGLRITGTEAKLTGSGSGDVLTIQATSVEVSALTIEVPAGGGSAVRVDGSGSAVLSSLIASRTQASTASDPVVDVAGAAQVNSSLLLQQGGAVGTPAIASTGTGGTRLADVIAASFTGPAVIFSASDANVVLRSTLLAAEASSDRSDAVQLLSANAGARKLVVDSSILVGGAKSAGVLVRSTGASAGASTLDLRHATITGAAKGVELDANGARGPGSLPGPAAPAGSITARAASSIVHPASSARRYQTADAGLLTSTNAVTLTFSDSDAPAGTAADGATVTMGNATSTPDAQLFAKGYTLRQDAPVIDKGGPVEAGESAKDVNGDPRQAGAATDKGADEFVNQAPKAAFELAPTSVKQDQLVGYASTSSDPEEVSKAGGGIVEYQWDFGDGTREASANPATLHKYAQVGTYTVTLVVKDRGGAVSAPATKTVTVVDGILPAASVTAPADGATLKLNPKKKKGARKAPKPRRLTVTGKATDASGVAKVEVALYATQRSEKGKRLKKGECFFYSGRLFVKKDCTKEIWIPLAVTGDGWRLKTLGGVRVPQGRYEIRVRATDAAGNLSTQFTVKDRSLVRFTVK